MRGGGLRNIDIYFSDFISSIEVESSDLLKTAARLVSEAVGRKETCVSLHEIEEVTGYKVTSELLKGFKTVGIPGEYKPLILDEDRVYLYRYWKYENDLAHHLNQMAPSSFDCDLDFISKGLDKLFGFFNNETDWQRIAAASAARNRLTIISGGPGTGKTATVLKIILLLLKMYKGDKFRIALAAPTGKAAARLKETLNKIGSTADLSEDTLKAFPDDVSTIHRLLGYIPDKPVFRFNSENKLPFEAVIVDEASMVSLPLMAKLCDAIPAGCRLILLGDKNQLSSVDAGGVLGALCEASDDFTYTASFSDYIFKTCRVSLEIGNNCTPFADSIITLKKNYRFSSSGGIAAVSAGTTSGDAENTLSRLKADSFSSVKLSTPPVNQDMKRYLVPVVLEKYAPYLSAGSPLEMLLMFDRFRILSHLRSGSHGVDNLSRLTEEILSAEGLIDAGKTWYHGRPVMVTVNDYSQRLFNGDIGIACSDSSSETGFTVYFRTPEGELKAVSPSILPEHETVYAMTIHKSQGSEFDSVLIVMPTSDSPLLTREILYTGLTRGKQYVQICCSDDIFLSTVKRKTLRNSALGLRFTNWIPAQNHCGNQ